MHTFKIAAPLASGKSRVELDGKPLSGVRRVAFDLTHDGGDTVLKLEIYGEVIVEDEFRESSIVKVEEARKR